MGKIGRRQFFKTMGKGFLFGWLIANRPLKAQTISPADVKDIYVARNGTPVTNVQAVIESAGGIERFIDQDDVVVLKPNGQWPRQGYSNTLCMKALIDVILARPGGFTGEIIIAEHIHRTPEQAMGGGYCWNISAGYNRQNNWPDMSYLELVADYHSRGIHGVTAIPMYDANQGAWTAAAGPDFVPAGMHAWVRLPQYRADNNRTITPSYPILRSAFSDKLIDLHRGGGVWENGGYNGQAVRLIFLPTLNNHGSGGEDYAGITSAVKCHIGFQEGTSLHSVGYNTSEPEAVGECVGHLITTVFEPTFFMTCAEYSGHHSRTGDATHTRTVGLCTDPVTLDYWMSKHVLFPCNSAAYFDPDNNNNTRRTLLGCQAKGVGTLYPSEMNVHLVDLNDASLRILSPNGMETWRRGEQRNIAWESTNITGNLAIELLQNDRVVGTIASGIDVSTGYYPWIVGRLENNAYVTGGNLKVRIRTTDGGLVAEMYF